jgi:flavin-dependent dehydrogenase
VGDRASDQPVTVVGAGVAGLASPIVLARAGRRVVLREWHKEVGTRFHGDFQGLENWSDELDALTELSEAGIALTFPAHPVYRGIAFDARGGEHEIRGDKPLFYLVGRGDTDSLEHHLLKHALDLGAEVRFGDRVETIDGPAILAGGPRTADIIAAGYIFETDQADGCCIVFDDRLAPLGYAYLLVHDGRGTLASCMFTRFKRQADYVARTVDFFADKTGLEMRNPRPFGGFGNLRLPRTAIQGGHPVAGEHAGFQNALAGFGMRYAMRSGILAARSIIDGTDYEQSWRRQLLPLLRASVVNRFLFNSIGVSGRNWAVRHLIRTNTARRLGSL